MTPTDAQVQGLTQNLVEQTVLQVDAILAPYVPEPQRRESIATLIAMNVIVNMLTGIETLIADTEPEVGEDAA